MKKHRLFLIFIMLVFSHQAFSQLITFPVGTEISGTGTPGIVQVVQDDYQITGQFRIYDPTVPYNGAHPGGLQVSTNSTLARGGYVEISRIDGNVFSLDGFTIMEKPGFASCNTNNYTCLPDPFTVTGYLSDNSAFSASIHPDNKNNTYDFMDSLSADSRFGNVMRAIISEDDLYILDSLTLSTNITSVPAPPAFWLMITGLLSLVTFKNRKLYSL